MRFECEWDVAQIHYGDSDVRYWARIPFADKLGSVLHEQYPDTFGALMHR